MNAIIQQPGAGEYVPPRFTDEHVDVTKNLTHQQRIFVETYLQTLDQNKAALQAGFTKKGAGTRLLKKPYIARCLELSFERRFHKLRVTEVDVISELCKLGFSNMGTYINKDGDGIAFDKLNSDQTSAIKKYKTKTRKFKDGESEVTIEFELYDKISALTKIGDTFGMFKQTHEISGPDGGAIQFSGIEIVGIQSGTFIEGVIKDGEVTVI